MMNKRQWLKASSVVVTAAGAAAVLGFGSGVSASADTVSGPAPWPASGAYPVAGPNVCGAGQGLETVRYNPRVSDDDQRVEAIGVVATTNAGCGASVNFQLETKVCGFWGCSWSTVDQVTYRDDSLPVNGALVSRVLSAPLRSGQNRYRLVTYTNMYTLTAEEGPAEDAPGIIGIESEGEADYPIGVQLGA